MQYSNVISNDSNFFFGWPLFAVSLQCYMNE